MLKLYEKKPLFVMPVNIEVGENKLRSPRNSAKYWMLFICVPKCWEVRIQSNLRKSEILYCQAQASAVDVL